MPIKHRPITLSRTALIRAALMIRAKFINFVHPDSLAIKLAAEADAGQVLSPLADVTAAQQVGSLEDDT